MSKFLAVLLLGCGSLAGTFAVSAEQLGAATPGAATPGATASGSATPAATAAASANDPRVALLKLLPTGSKLEDLRASPIPGIYEFAQGADVSYLTADGKFFIDGNVYDMATRENLTEDLRTHARLALINAVPESQMLIFSPKNPQYTITVFTDVDCQYCRKLHSEMAELNKLGVRVRYMFYPRSGPNTDSWRKAEAVWCATDRNEALTRAKMGTPVDTSKKCAVNPVAREYELGQSIGVRGTPAIITDTGDYINGYMPPHDLIEELKELQGGKRKG